MLFVTDYSLWFSWSDFIQSLYMFFKSIYRLDQ